MIAETDIIKSKFRAKYYIVLILLILSIVNLFFWAIYDDAGDIAKKTGITTSLISFFILIAVLNTIKNYEKIGKLIINSEAILIEQNAEKTTYGIDKQKHILLIYSGYKGEYEFGFRKLTVKSGQNNHIFISGENHNEKFDLIINDQFFINRVSKILADKKNVTIQRRNYDTRDYVRSKKRNRDHY